MRWRRAGRLRLGGVLLVVGALCACQQSAGNAPMADSSTSNAAGTPNNASGVAAGANGAQVPPGGGLAGTAGGGAGVAGTGTPIGNGTPASSGRAP